ncbi:MAG: tRNA-splicing ligase RtcB [Verrucomicrobiales bacterium]|jgi:tRNA-splicing ligase RtcB
MEFSRQDLLDAGWREDAPFDVLLQEAARLIEKGNTESSYILKRLDRVYARHQPTMAMREEPIAFAEAVEATTKEEEKNLKAARRTMRELMACPVVEAGALMPDTCPAGSAIASIPVGGAVAVRRAIIPAAHGADICCSMQATVFEAPADVSVASLMDQLVGVTRFGPGGRHADDWVAHPVADEDVWENPFLRGFEKYARMYLADQGDGNHFAFMGTLEVDEAMLDALSEAGHGDTFQALKLNQRYHVLITHHGSRGLGARVYQRGLEAAIKQTKQVATSIPEAAAWLSIASDEGRDYWDALQYLSRWTLANHRLIHDRFLEALGGVDALANFGNEHNFVWQRGDLFLHGKGATPAWHDEADRPLLGLIPLNMASPVLLVLGGDQSDYLSFAPHGAGRNLSRKGIIRQFRQRDGSLDEDGMARALEEATQDLEVCWYRGKPDLTESPIGYKPAATVRAQIESFQLAHIVADIHPLGSIMAGRGKGRDEELSPKQLRQMDHRANRRKDRQHLREDWQGLRMKVR